MIPRKLHIVWVGDVAKRPDRWISTWRDKHPDWNFRLWGNEELHDLDWQLKPHMMTLFKERHFHGVSDLMRYEILATNGGVYVDADSICLEPLDDLLTLEAFAVFQNEKIKPGLVANGFLGAGPGCPIFLEMIDIIKRRHHPLPLEWHWRKLGFRRQRVWSAIGPGLLTKVLNERQHSFTLLPSYTFLPKFFKGGDRYQGAGKIYADHYWGTSLGKYSEEAASPARSHGALGSTSALVGDDGQPCLSICTSTAGPIEARPCA